MLAVGVRSCVTFYNCSCGEESGNMYRITVWQVDWSGLYAQVWTLEGSGKLSDRLAVTLPHDPLQPAPEPFISQVGTAGTLPTQALCTPTGCPQAPMQSYLQRRFRLNCGGQVSYPKCNSIDDIPCFKVLPAMRGGSSDSLHVSHLALFNL